MPNPAPKLDDADYERNFADINPRLTATAAVAEAARCLFCYDAPCIRACPTAIDIPSFIKKIVHRQPAGAPRAPSWRPTCSATPARGCARSRRCARVPAC